MLQPEPSVSQPSVMWNPVEQPSGVGWQHCQQSSSSPVLPKHGFWQWITFKEVVFVFLLCSAGALLFRSKDTVQFYTIWKEKIDTNHFANLKFPVEDEKMPRPVISDLNNDGNMDVLIFTSRTLLKLVTISSAKNPYKPPEEQHTLAEEGWADMVDFGSSGSVRPAAMATGYLQKFQSMVQVRKQVVVVLLSDWTVLCFDHTLRLLWKSKVGESMVESWGLSISEAAILVTSVGIQKGDYGSVIVGGREIDPENIEQSVDRLRRVVNEKNEERMLSSLGHYTVYALEGRGGVVRWQHTPTDFQETVAYSSEKSSFHHLKLSMHKQSQHVGEVSWHQYSSALRDTMPHSWQHSMDTHFTLSHFKKDQRPSEKSELKDHFTKVGGLAVDHMTGLAFGGHPPHTATEHVQDPNVLVLHSVKGIEVMHLFQGRPLCTLHLSPYHSSHLDINGDGIIDRVSAIHNPGEFGGPHQSEEEEEEDCYGVATPMDSRPLFKHSICKATHWTEAFVNTDKWIPNLNKVGRKKVNHRLTEPLAPVLIPSSYHSNPLKLHIGAPGWDVNSVLQTFVGSPKPGRRPSLSSFASPAAPLYDSVFILSSGRVTSIGPHGEFNWQVDCQSDWDIVSEVIYDPTHSWWHEKPEMIQLLQGAFVPSATAFSLRVNGKEDHILVMGWDKLTLLSAEDGVPVTSTQFNKCNPMAPVLVEDFNGDGWNDVILVCQDKYWGIALHNKSGFWNKTLMSAFIGVVIVAVAMYTRQRTVGLLPPIKSD